MCISYEPVISFLGISCDVIRMLTNGNSKKTKGKDYNHPRNNRNVHQFING